MNFWTFLAWWILGACSVYALCDQAGAPTSFAVIMAAIWPFGLPLLGIGCFIALLVRAFRDMGDIK